MKELTLYSGLMPRYLKSIARKNFVAADIFYSQSLKFVFVSFGNFVQWFRCFFECLILL